MPSLRQMKKKYLRRIFVSSAQTIDGLGYWPPSIYGLAFGDVRSHQKRPKQRSFGASHLRISALNTHPVDLSHGARKGYKKDQACDIASYKRDVRWRNLNRSTHHKKMLARILTQSK